MIEEERLLIFAPLLFFRRLKNCGDNIDAVQDADNNSASLKFNLFGETKNEPRRSLYTHLIFVLLSFLNF